MTIPIGDQTDSEGRSTDKQDVDQINQAHESPQTDDHHHQPIVIDEHEERADEDHPIKPPSTVDIIPSDIILLPTNTADDSLEWNDDYCQVLASLAHTGLPPSPSPGWKKIMGMILISLRRTVESYLRMGDRALFDSREEPAGGWLWTEEDVQKGIDRLSNALYQFNQPDEQQQQDEVDHPQSEPMQIVDHKKNHIGIEPAPFTIQRLVELVFPNQQQGNTTTTTIHPHYSTLPKYIRAIQRVLSVSSPVSSFSINTFSLSPPPPPPPPSITDQEDPSTTQLSINGNDPKMYPSPVTIIRPRIIIRPSTSTPVTPTLSPIPWLSNNTNSDQPNSPKSSEGHQSRHSSPFMIINDEINTSSSSLTSSTLLGSPGRIDELDSGSGTNNQMIESPIPINSQPIL